MRRRQGVWVVVEGEGLDNLSSDRVNVRQRLEINIGKLSDNSLDGRLERLVGEKRRLGLCISTCFLDVVDSGQHSNSPVLEDGQLLRQLLL